MTLVALAGAVTRFTLFAAVLVSTGAAAFRFLLLPRVVADEESRAILMRRAASLGRIAALLLLVAILARVPLQLAEIRNPDLPLAPQLKALMFATLWGRVWIAQLALVLILVKAFGAARKEWRPGWAWAAATAVLLAVTPALSGHAIGSERLPALAVTADVLHALGAGAWLGAMLVLFAGLAVLHQRGESPLAGALVSAFSPLAIAASTLLVVTGVVSSWLHLGALAPLWQSRYGLTLLAKLAAVGVMGLLGLYNWRRAGPALRATGNVDLMRRSIRSELLVGMLVLAITAVLVATPPPGSE